jgi:hypothetical protein
MRPVLHRRRGARRRAPGPLSPLRAFARHRARGGRNPPQELSRPLRAAPGSSTIVGARAHRRGLPGTSLPPRVHICPIKRCREQTTRNTRSHAGVAHELPRAGKAGLASPAWVGPGATRRQRVGPCLTSAALVRNALAYVLLNHRSHRARAGERVGAGAPDPFSSGGGSMGGRGACRSTSA